jgi:hypothetical protein
VPRLTQDQKEAAFHSQQQATGAAVTAGAVAAGTALIPGFGLFISAGVGMIGAALSFRALRQGKLHHDPPRSDFRSETTLEPPAFNPDALGDLPIDVAPFVRVTDELARIFGAMDVAIERASGAELENDAEMAQARSAEVLAFADRASARLIDSSELTGPLRAALRERASGLPLPPFAFFEPTSRDPVDQLIRALGLVAEADSEYAVRIRADLQQGVLLEPGVA